MKLKSLCVLKYCFVLAMLIISLHLVLTYFNKKETFINLERKYKSLRNNVSGKLESMINIIPDVNPRKIARRLKRKYL